MQALVCPTDGELSEYTLGCLSAERLEEVAEHLDRCPACSTRLIRIGTRPDSLAEAVRDAGQVAAYGPDVAATPTVLRDYRIEDVLGEGGMGTVYRAMHMRLGRPVALKLLTARRRLDPDAGARFEREMRAIGALRHPHIVQATDAGDIDGVPFLVMEFVEGTDLGRLIKSRGPLAVADACEAARQAALGLQHAHEHGLVHRDVKPGNLMLASDGMVKLLDLGLARSPGTDEPEVAAAADLAPRDSALTATNMLVGTQAFMAPEQRSDPRSVDARADLFALGRTLCFLLTGAADFPAAGKVPSGLLKVLQRLQAERPAARYPTAAAVAKALHLWARGADLAGLLGTRQRRPSRRPRLLFVAATVLVVVAIVVALSLYRSRPVDENPTAKADPEQKLEPKTEPAAQKVAPQPGRLGMTPEEAVDLQQQWADYLKPTPTTAEAAGLKMVVIPPGELDLIEGVHVRITQPYLIGVSEVTRKQFREFVNRNSYVSMAESLQNGTYVWKSDSGNGGRKAEMRLGADLTWRTPGYPDPADDDPVIMVNWNDAKAFCQWLSATDGRTYRLPTLAESMWASRAGSTCTWPGGTVRENDDKRLELFAWTERNSPTRPRKTGQLKSNDWGLYDSVGNVSEWCRDWWGELREGTYIDYLGPATGTVRVTYGGWFAVRPDYSHYEGQAPSQCRSSTGFRVVREP
ncbi:MAG TPA: SUMF1/EgtB/PvdO family nonheme iron enzyme [Gemmataceae bacterium]|jgi:serine/threonine protein kinase|nr:SUMF1/EgtB/PvdO family nonheme iron enzyme [Gemmataceae bacterium]